MYLDYLKLIHMLEPHSRLLCYSASKLKNIFIENFRTKKKNTEISTNFKKIKINAHAHLQRKSESQMH